MGTESTRLRWKDHSLFPYRCAGCGTQHQKGEGVYLDQSGPRTKTYDSPQCADTTSRSPAPTTPPPPVREPPSFVPASALLPGGRQATLEGTVKTTAVGPSDGGGRAPPGQLTLTMSLHGRDVEVVLRGQNLEKVTLEKFVQGLSRFIVEELPRDSCPE